MKEGRGGIDRRGRKEGDDSNDNEETSLVGQRLGLSLLCRGRRFDPWLGK